MSKFFQGIAPPFAAFELSNSVINMGTRLSAGISEKEMLIGILRF